MRFRTITETTLKPLDRVFKESRLMRTIAVLAILVMVGAGIAIVPLGAGWFGWVFATVSGLLSLPLAFGFINTFRSENWLMRYSPPKLLIKIRSCDNHRFPDDDPVVMELDTSEIAWVRKLREKIITTSDEGGNQRETRTYLELKLRSGSTGELEQQVKDERARSHKGFKVLHYPVQAMPEGVIRVQWRSGSSWITPKVEEAMAMLKSVVEVRAEEMEVRDYTTTPADKEAQEAQILELAERGQTFDAIRLARKRYGYSLTQAKQFVEELQGRSANQPR